VPITEWNLVAVSRPTAKPFTDDKGHPPAPHIEIDRFLILLLEGRDLMPEMYEHLLECTRCRNAVIPAVSEELRQRRHARTCATHERLLREWREAVEMYARTVIELVGKVGEGSVPELSEVAIVTEIVRGLTAQVCNELDEHIATHHC
jgi:hypothetical protein